MTVYRAVRHGGLMRCCLATLDDYAERNPDKKDAPGTKLDCQYCKSAMIVARDGIWEWNKEKEKPCS